MRKNKPATVVELEDIQCLRETDAALLVDVEGEEIWIPKSQLRDGNELLCRGDVGRLVISRWIAEQKNLL